MTFRINKTDAEGILYITAIDMITAEDYQECLLPVLSQFRESGKKARLLLNFGPEFKGYTAGAAWEDAKLGLRYMRVIERCAVVSDQEWIKNTASIFGKLIPCSVSTYKNKDLAEAKEWLQSGDIGLDHTIDKEDGIVNVEISAPISSINMEILSHTVDGYIEDGKTLKGLVIHAKKFPGWEDLGSMISHLSFIKNHHQKIDKVALTVDGTLADLVEKIAKNFGKAEVKHFNYDQLDEANEWVREF